MYCKTSTQTMLFRVVETAEYESILSTVQDDDRLVKEKDEYKMRNSGYLFFKS